jgi:hypothetical protein
MFTAICPRSSFSLFLQLLVCVATGIFARAVHAEAAPRLKISENHRFITYDDGRPFFYLGDTAWELFHRLTREEADRYLEDRAKKGYTVIQAVALAEEDGLNTPNAYGHRPLVENDPLRPDVKDGVENDYWDHVDYIVDKAASLRLFIGLLPTWGDKWNKKWGVGPEIFTPKNAEIYGEWLGARYKDKPIVWILGGDRPVENDNQREIIRAMARGLAKGDGGEHLRTLHPTGGSGSAQYFHNEEWLDFNMRQNGHVAEYNKRYDQTRADYDRQPPKPVLDAEPLYEDHPLSFKAAELGYSTASDVRRPLYWDLFGGACGHTYGHHSVWQFASSRVPPRNNPLLPWVEAIQQPGAMQMQYARRLLESRPYFTRIPDDSVIVDAAVKTSVPGAGRYRFVATRDSDGSFAMVYAPVGRAFNVRMDKIAGEKVKAWWFNPRNGEATAIGEFTNAGTHEFKSPDPHEGEDWVLVLDDAAKNFPPPGQRAK